MARKKFSSFLLGLFVTGGFLILAVILIWIGATQYFERGRSYISYFNESVQGLQKDSEVKFRGVKVGRVEDIVIAPDNRQVGVIMVVDLKFDPTKDYVAQLQLTGITGVMFVNLVPARSRKAVRPPRAHFCFTLPGHSFPTFGDHKDSLGDRRGHRQFEGIRYESEFPKGRRPLSRICKIFLVERKRSAS